MELLWLSFVILLGHTRFTNADNLIFNCDYSPDFSEKMHLEKGIFLDHLSKILGKTDVNKLSSKIQNFTLKTNEDYMKEIVSSLPTMDTIDDIMDQISNSSSSLQYDLDKIKEKMSSMSLSTHETMKILSNKLLDIATKEDLQNTEKEIMKLSQILQDTMTKDNLNISTLLSQEDNNKLISTFSSIISKQDVENLFTEMNLLSTTESLNELYKKMSDLPKKEDLESMGLFIEDTSLLKKDIKVIMEKSESFASKDIVQNLENAVNALEVKVDAYLEDLSNVISIASILLEDMEAQDELINSLELHFNELRSSERLINLKELLLTTYLSTNATLEYIMGEELLDVINPTNDCVESHEVEERMGKLHGEINSACNRLRLRDLLSSFESKILNTIGNASMAVTTEKIYQEPPSYQITAKSKRIIGTSSCLDSEFVGAPADLDICSAIVARNLCSTDPLMSYHCCRSCVRAGHIQEMGPHRYLQEPRKINYNAGIWKMTLDKN